jgi:hypothetical protein
MRGANMAGAAQPVAASAELTAVAIALDNEAQAVSAEMKKMKSGN